LHLGFWTSLGSIVVFFGGVGGRYLIGHSISTQEGKWVKVSEIDRLPAGQVHKMTYEVRTRDAWRETKQKGALYIHADDNGEYTVLSATCTHLGCNVRWKEGEEKFGCPCHEAYFSREGEVISGPAREPLRRHEYKIEDGVLLALV
jgi:menaquinol-cytochrome c reductase iron-sulfur subunit